MAEVSLTIEAGDGDDRATKPFWAKCRKCSHCWPAAYYPMDIMTIARITKNVRCPKCGDGKPVVAKQCDGELREDG